MTEGHPKGWKGVRSILLVGPFHRKLATGSDVIFPRVFFLVVVQNVGLGCSLGHARLPLSLVICPFYFHNYILSLLFSDMLCSTPRVVFLRVK